MISYYFLCIYVLYLSGAFCGSVNTPPQLIYQRQWVLHESEPIGSVIDRIRVVDEDNDEVRLTLVRPTFKGSNLRPDGFRFFELDDKGKVTLRKSLKGLAGQTFLVGILAEDGGIRGRYDVKVDIKREDGKVDIKTERYPLHEFNRRGGLPASFNPGPPPPSFHDIISHHRGGGPPLLDLDPNTVWKVLSSSPVGTFVTRVEADDLGNTFLEYSLYPSSLLWIDPQSGDVSVAESLNDKEGDYTFTVKVSNEHAFITQDVILRIIDTDQEDVDFLNENSTTSESSTPRPLLPKIPTLTITDEVISKDDVLTRENEVGNATVRIAFIIIGVIVILLVVMAVTWYWCRKSKARMDNKENSVTFTKESSVTPASSINNSDTPKGTIFNEIFSMVSFRKRAESNTYEGSSMKKPKVPSRENTSKSKKSSIMLPRSNDKWEFPRHKLRFVGILGEGCFGQVWKCEAGDLDGVGENRNFVAVKTLKESSGAEEKKDLLQELKVLKSLAAHPNVVSFLGCCTEKDPVFVILEYMTQGKLQSYLRASRAKNFYDNLHGKSCNLSPKDLTIFALQIAKGMDFLSKNNIVHRDLAARNILVGEDKICKVADFGFARDIATNHVYERRSDGRMPIRWMAPESLHDNVFTTKSDVWSFGILLWEIVTLGSTPYPGMSAAEVMRKVREGYRLEKPEHCRREIYNIMYYCWDADSVDRPSFSELVKDLDSLLSTEVEYIRLDNFPNRTYYNFTSTYASGELL